MSACEMRVNSHGWNFTHSRWLRWRAGSIGAGLLVFMFPVDDYQYVHEL
jgi:hypothetical protein